METLRGAEVERPEASLPIYGGDDWKKRNEAEVASRPRVLPLNKRHFWTPAELQRLRDNRAAGMSEKDAVAAALAQQTV